MVMIIKGLWIVDELDIWHVWKVINEVLEFSPLMILCVVALKNRPLIISPRSSLHHFHSPRWYDVFSFEGCSRSDGLRLHFWTPQWLVTVAATETTGSP